LGSLNRKCFPKRGGGNRKGKGTKDSPRRKGFSQARKGEGDEEHDKKGRKLTKKKGTIGVGASWYQGKRVITGGDG